MRQRIGFLGGTFDPPHRGHVRLAELAMQRLGLQRVLLAPVGVQPLKLVEAPGAAWQQRLHMVELAVQGRAGLEASPVDAPRPDGRPNYSVETLARVRDQFPEAELYFLLGADAFAGLRRWHDPTQLLQMCELVVANRPGFQLPQDGNALLEWMPEGTRFLGLEETRVGDQGPGTRRQQPEPEAAASPAEAQVFLAGSALVRVYLLEKLAEDIAATDLRAMLARGDGYDWLPGGEHGAVAEYIREQQLYTDPDKSPSY